LVETLGIVFLSLFAFILMVLVIHDDAFPSAGKSPAVAIKKRGISMKNWSLGRLDISLPEQFKIIGRNQSIYQLQVDTIPLQGKSAQELWDERVNYVRNEHIANGYSLDTFKVTEISPGFSAVFYKGNQSMPFLVTVEAYKPVPGHIFKMKFTGEEGKEDVMLRGISLTADDYRSAIENGFNIGAGSLVSPPSVNESASATFEDNVNHMRLRVYLHTAGSRLSKGPMHNIDEEIKGLGAEGIKLRVLHRRSRKAAGFSGEDALVELKGPMLPGLRYTWFYAGETANSFKPEIRIQMKSAIENQEEATAVWNLIIDSMKMREP